MLIESLRARVFTRPLYPIIALLCLALAASCGKSDDEAAVDEPTAEPLR